MSKQRIDLGRAGEEIAADYLIKREMQIIARNYRQKFGEIDIIARDDDTYVFVEVKTRSTWRYGHPAEAVTADKQRQICLTAEHYLATHGLAEAPARFDVVAVTTASGGPQIDHFISAFDAP